MRVVLLTTFVASRKEPLVTMMNRVHQAFPQAGLDEPAIRFHFTDHPVPGSTSSVQRVLKRFPTLQRFVTDAPLVPGMPGMLRISNGAGSEAAGQSLPYEILEAIAAGVPRSFPFNAVAIHFVADEFGPAAPAPAPHLLPGVLLGDNWWVNGRVRTLSACTVVEGDPSARKLPPLPPPVAAVLAACGKVRKTVLAPLPGEVRAEGAAAASSTGADSAAAVRQMVSRYRAQMPELARSVGMPHELPPRLEALRANVGVASGPRKPALERAFKPMGYDCRGGSGTFTLRRRTATNLTVELELDVGTWSNLVTAAFRVLGLGFKAALPLPVCPECGSGEQYPIGDAAQWERIVENVAALVRELDRSFVPEIEEAAGPSPEWYRPES
jgi:hypothetical protein